MKGGFVERLLRRRAFKEILQLASSAALAQGLAIAAMPVLARLYTPEDFGQLGVYAALLGLVLTLGCGRYEAAIPLPAEDQEARNVTALSLRLLFLVSGLSGVALCIGLWWSPTLSAPMLLLVPGVLGAGLSSIALSWGTRRRAFGGIARSRLSQSGSMLGVQLGLGAIGLGPLGLLVGDALGRMAGGLGAFHFLRQEDPEIPGYKPLWQVRAEELRASARRWRRFPVYSLPSAFLNTACLQGPALVLAVIYSHETTGLFLQSQRVLGLPSALIGQAVAQVFLSRAASLAREGQKEELRRLFAQTVFRLSLVALPIALGAALLGPWAFAVVFGDAWETAGTFARWLAPAMFFQIVSAPLGFTLDVLQRQDLHLGREIVRAALVGSALGASFVLDFSPEHSVVALGLAMALGYLFHLVTSWYALRSIS